MTSHIEALFQRTVRDLGQAMAADDMRDAKVFQRTFWMITHLGLSQTEFAEHEGYQPTTVSRWANGSKIPPVKRRPVILRAALAMLRAQVEGSAHPMLGSIDDNRHALDGRSPGRPKKRIVEILPSGCDHG